MGKYSLDKLLKSFSIHTAVSLAIEWVFNSVSLAIETRYQNMAVQWLFGEDDGSVTFQ